MKKILLLALISFSLNDMKSQTPTLTLLNSYSLTPNSTDTIGAFARIFYHSLRNKFYVIYAARQAGSASPSGVLSNFAWREYNSSMVFTGNKGSLSGHTSAGDYAMVQVDSTYYHLTLASPTANYKLTKYDDDFTIISTKTISLNSCSSNIDQLMNYTNGRLIIGAMYDNVNCPPTNPPSMSLLPNSEINQYDLSLNSLATSTITTPTKITWGASMIYNAGFYYEITMDNFNNRDLYAFKYDANFNYKGSTLLNSDGQWSQGVIFDAGYYYVAHHTGEHNKGNVLLSIYDSNWTIQNTTTVTTFPVLSSPGSSNNANRPFITKVGTKLYVSYDIESYNYPVNNKDWQSGVKVYQINTPATAIEENSLLSNISVYPNPAEDFFQIKLNDQLKGNYSIEIKDILGKLVYQSNTNELKANSNLEYSIPTSDLETGTYFISLKGDAGVCTKKIIISK